MTDAEVLAFGFRDLDESNLRINYQKVSKPPG